MDITFNVGGAAGQGIDKIGDLLTQIFVKAGFYTFTIKDFESRIRGGYNFTQVRVSDIPVYASNDEIDVIVALSKDAIVGKRDQLVDNGVIIFDESIEFTDIEQCHLPLPLEKTAKEIGGSTRMTNSAALGAVLSVLKYPIEMAAEALSVIFKKKGEKVIQPNIEVARAIYDIAQKHFKGECRHDLSTMRGGPSEDRLVISGNRAIALGALAANVKWVSSYPMSPSTGAFQDIMAVGNDLKVAALQTEDEIASLTMAIGASFVGARSLVTTSGGGFSLMVEGLGLAAMTETPVVIYNAQRPGPATGLPTRTEQGDLLFMAHASQGEFPRILLAPKDPLEGFHITRRAFDLAERFQVPVMILGDQYFADSAMNIPRIDVTNMTIDRGKLAPKEPDPEYKRFQLTEDGISPRAFPGDEGKIVVASGNTHREDGHISEDPEIRDAMVEKFMKKIPAIRAALSPPVLEGPPDADVTVLTWGTCWGAVFEAVNILAADGVSINQLHFSDVYPMRTERLEEVFGNAKRVISIEQNATSQFARLVRMETGLGVDERINKYDGRPMTANWVIARLKEVGVQ